MSSSSVTGTSPTLLIEPPQKENQHPSILLKVEKNKDTFLYTLVYFSIARKPSIQLAGNEKVNLSYIHMTRAQKLKVLSSIPPAPIPISSCAGTPCLGKTTDVPTAKSYTATSRRMRSIPKLSIMAWWGQPLGGWVMPLMRVSMLMSLPPNQSGNGLAWTPRKLELLLLRRN